MDLSFSELVEALSVGPKEHQSASFDAKVQYEALYAAPRPSAVGIEGLH